MSADPATTRQAHAQPWCRWEGGDLFLAIHVQPRARRDEFVGAHGDALKIRLTAPPVEGQANEQLLRFIANALHIPTARVTLVGGTTARAKRLRVAGPLKIPKELHEWICPTSEATAKRL